MSGADGVVEFQPIERETWGAADLAAAHPPQLRHPNKQVVFDVACPPGSRHDGSIGYSRWPARSLPLAVHGAGAAARLDEREGIFDYERVLPDEDGTEWHVNFADSHLFAYYGGQHFAQDEMQAAEHPALGSVREALVAGGLPALTIEGRRPTPVLITGVERRCIVDTSPRPGEVYGIYGKGFRLAGPEVVQQATTRIEPPTITNILAIAALAHGHGPYSMQEIEFTLQTAYTGFRAAVRESATLAGREAPVVVHTGYWGGGAFGGNRVLMSLLQVLAAELAGIDRLVFHTGHHFGSDPLDRALRLLRTDLGVEGAVPTAEIVVRIANFGFQWGNSDGN